MEKQIIEFKIHDQQLEMLTPLRVFSTDKVNYIEARIHNLEDKYWTGYDVVYAVWFTDDVNESSRIADGVTMIPQSVLKRPGKLQMNLCANKSEKGILTARMTSYPVDVLQLTKAWV